MKNSYLPGVLVSILFIFFSVSANAVAPVITNGSFTGTVNTDTTTPNAAPGWTVTNSTPEVVGETAPTNNTGLPWVLSPDGGTFAKLNGTLNPVSREAIEQTISGFTIGETYELYFFQTNLGWYWAKFNEWYDHEGYLEFYIDDILVGQSTVVQAPSNFDQPNQWSSGKISFVAAAETQTLRIGANTTATVPDPSDTSNSSLTTAYMAVDGVRFFGEVCANGIDDDGDGLVDGDDPDCDPVPPPRIGLNVRCLHEPIYPQLGDQVTITAEAIDNDGNEVVPDLAEIFVGDLVSPVNSVTNQNAFATFQANSGSFSYGCRIEKDSDETKSWNHFDKKLRSVDVGSVNNPDWKAIPVIYNGPVGEKIDIVFFPDDDEYSSFSDPNFLADVHDLIDEGYFTIPSFVQFQWLFNFWVAMDNTADASPNLPAPSGASQPFCNNKAPSNYERDYPWVQAAGIVHPSKCRDNAASGVFTIEMDAKRMQVLAHEIGHAAFGFADEYCCDGGYFSSEYRERKEEYDPPFPNLFRREIDCQNDAFNRPYLPSDCRPIVTKGDFVWWIGEPDYGAGIPKVDEIRDLMQQTGGEELSPSLTVDRYKVGDSERDRLIWLLGKCLNGDC